MNEKPTVLTTSEARQGSPRKMNARVLAGSLVLAVVAGIVLYAAFYNDELPGSQNPDNPDSAPADDRPRP